MTPGIKIVVPMAGLGTRMRPHTWSKPKPLICVAGKPSLDHLLDMFTTIPANLAVEYVFIIGQLGDQIRLYMDAAHPGLRVHYIVQPIMRGQSDALWLARQHLKGAVLVVYSDTLIETDFSQIAGEPLDGIAWVQPVPDPRRFGVAEANPPGHIMRLIEKPQSMENNLALVGCYYFKSGEALSAAIEEQIRQGVQLKGEYFLADAINIMLERGARIRTEIVGTWLDTGTIEATLETNAYLLSHGKDNSQEAKRKAVTIVPPVFIHPSAEVIHSTIGPDVSIGANCHIANSRIENSIVEEGTWIEAIALRGSMIGRQARIEGRGRKEPAMQLNIADNSQILR